MDTLTGLVITLVSGLGALLGLVKFIQGRFTDAKAFIRGVIQDETKPIVARLDKTNGHISDLQKMDEYLKGRLGERHGC